MELNNITQRISNFVEDLEKEVLRRGIKNFETAVVRDDDEDEVVYFVYHNRYDLERCKAFEEFASVKMDEYFFSHGIFDVCFTHDYEFEQAIKIKLFLTPKERDDKININISNVTPSDGMKFDILKSMPVSKKQSLVDFNAVINNLTDFPIHFDTRGGA
jgi:hypothetical protein